MSDLKFSCPSCQQHIQAGAEYAGLQITCPACAAPMMVPGTPVAAVAAALVAPSPAYAAPAGRPATPAAATGCPSCGAPLARGAILCTKCGYNLATKKRTVAGKVVPLGSRMAPSGEVPWYKTPWPYVGVTVLLLGGLYFGGKSNPEMKMAFYGSVLLYWFVVQIFVLIAAFRESVGTGFLTLCVPPYGVYFVFKVNENTTLQVLYSFAAVIGLILKFASFD